jgi:hypothetical protein
MGMLGGLYFRGGNQHLARHAQVNDPLPAGRFVGAKIKDNMLADAAYLPSSTAEISAADDLSGSGLLPTQTESMRSPATRLFSPFAIVSTSGNSGIVSWITPIDDRSFACGSGFRLQAHACKMAQVTMEIAPGGI